MNQHMHDAARRPRARRAKQAVSKLFGLAALSISVAMLLLPVFAVGVSAAEISDLPRYLGEAVGSMAIAIFVSIGLADLLIGGIR